MAVADGVLLIKPGKVPRFYLWRLAFAFTEVARKAGSPLALR
jgi:hypothetical protein